MQQHRHITAQPSAPAARSGSRGRTAASAHEAYQQARPGGHVLGWSLERAQRKQLLSRFPPRYACVVADHVTLRPKVAADAPLPPRDQALIIGRCDDGHGVEALVVRMAGTTDRPDGSTYHITWSLAKGRQARESNDAIAAGGWEPIEPPVPVRLQPKLDP